MWSYTPRQIVAFVKLRRARQGRERADALEVAALGSRGDSKTIKERFRTWLKG